MPRPTSDCRATERKHPWPMVRLGDVCEVVLGGTPKTGITEYWDGDIPWLTPGDMGKITQMYVDASNCKRKISQLGLDNGSTLCPARSVILSTRAPIGYAFVNSVPMATNQGCKTLVPSDDVYPEYLCFNLLGRTDELNELGTGTTFKELATGRLKAMTLPLPPLSVQREIVARLERELATVEKMKKGFEALAETARAEFKAELKEVFEEISRRGAETRRLGDVCDVRDGTHDTPAKCNKGYLLLTSKNVRNGKVDKANAYYISASDYVAINKRSGVDQWDVLFSMIGTVGETAIVDETPDFAIKNMGLLKTRANELLARWIKYFFDSQLAKQLILDRMKGANQKFLSLGALREFPLVLTNRDSMVRLVARLDSAKARAEKLETKAREGVAVCETMRKAILKEAFAPCCAGEVA